MKILCAALGIVLAVLLAGTGLFHSLLSRIHYSDPRDNQNLTQQQLEEYLAAETEPLLPGIPVMDPAMVSFGNPAAPIGSDSDQVISILLIGQDRRPGESRSRSDSLILCTLNKRTKQLIFTSILRDLYVQIPGYADNRINAAYAAGGIPLLNDTLEHNLGIRADGNVEVDFNQFQIIVDLLGGVTIELRQDEADLLNRALDAGLSSGMQTLTGEQALHYSRIRSLDDDGDFSRTERQRRVMGAILDSCKHASIKTLLGMAERILPMITTDMSHYQILSYALELFPILSELEIISQRIPADGTYSEKTIRGMSVLVADMDAARVLLEQTLLGKNS